MKKLVAVLAICLALVGCTSESAQEENHDIQENVIEQEFMDFTDDTRDVYFEAKCVNVVDGDTIDVEFGSAQNSSTERVRLIGIDTPETKHPSKPVEYYGAEATKYTTDKLLNKDVWLEYDVSERDKYGRLLAYIWINKPDTAEPTDDFIRDNMFNAMIVKNGYAKPYTYPPDVKHDEIIVKLGRSARENGYGLWNEPVTAPMPKVTPQPQPAQTVELMYIGNKNTKKFHYPSCGSVGQMKESNKVALYSRGEAIDFGYVPCGKCRP